MGGRNPLQGPSNLGMAKMTPLAIREKLNFYRRAIFQSPRAVVLLSMPAPELASGLIKETVSKTGDTTTLFFDAYTESSGNQAGAEGLGPLLLLASIILRYRIQDRAPVLRHLLILKI